MTREPSNVLTPERHECLRLISIGAARDAHGVLWEPQRRRLTWLRDHGLIALDVVPPRSTAEQRRESRKVTALGRRVLELWGREVVADGRRGVVVGVEMGMARGQWSACVHMTMCPGGAMARRIDAVRIASDEQIGAAS